MKDTLFVIKQNPLRLHNVVVLRGMKPYRYVRYYGPENSYCDVSEVAFYETAKDTCALQGKPMGASNAPDGDLTHDYTNILMAIIVLLSAIVCRQADGQGLIWVVRIG